MKIIRKRAGADWWIGKQCTCDECHSVIELEKGDQVKEYIAGGMYGAMFKCPECGKKTLRVYLT